MNPMLNMYEAIRDNWHFNKFSVGEPLFVEYKCPIEQDTDLERLFRDVQAARHHPLPESEQVKFSGEYLVKN